MTAPPVSVAPSLRRLPSSPGGLRQSDLQACRETLRQGSKSFLAASWLLPRHVHEPAAALYAFCRLADDAVDGLAAGDPVAQLRARLARIYAGSPDAHPADRALAEVVVRHGIPRALFDALLEGFEWDCQGRRYGDESAMLDYAARVAGSVGAMMCLLMGARSEQALARACDLGVAMQLSNIARDVGEDARLGRLYLPETWLRAEGLQGDAWLRDPHFTPALGRVVARVLELADTLYARVDAGISLLPAACRPGITAARVLYAGIGHEVARRGHDSISARAYVPGRRKAWLVTCAFGRLADPLRLRASAALAEPPLAATQFLIEAAVGAEAPITGMSWATRRPHPAGLGHTRARGWHERLIWTIELFDRLERRERMERLQRARPLGAAGSGAHEG